MPRILLNPNLAVPPDFSTAFFAPSREVLLNDDRNEDQATHILLNFWQATNNLEKQKWNDQVANDRAEADEQRGQHDAAQLQQDLQAAQERDAAHREEVKRNRAKYIAVPDRPVPAINPVIASNYATKKLGAGAYLELWYFTNEGLEDALNSHQSVDDSAMVLSNNPDGSTSWITATSSRGAGKVRSDKDLTMEDFCHAVTRIIPAMEDADWPPDRVQMFATFWGNVLTHRFRSSPKATDQKALLTYQDKQRRLWHMAITSPRGGYNLSIIDETILLQTRDEVYSADRELQDNQRNYHVSPRTTSISCNTHSHISHVLFPTLALTTRIIRCVTPATHCMPPLFAPCMPLPSLHHAASLRSACLTTASCMPHLALGSSPMPHHSLHNCVILPLVV
jgi:hypothetical protein